MKPLRNQVITFRVDDETKAKIDEMAEEKEWSISQVVERICRDYFRIMEEKKNEQV